LEHLGRSAADELADELTALVVSGEFRPGQRLVEADLAARYNVSRGPVRSALSTLYRLGLVEMRPKGGMVVVDLTPSDVRDLYEVRIALERAAVERLTRASNVDWSILRGKVEELEGADSRGNSGAATASSMDFHRNLCVLSGNERLLRAWEAQSSLIKLAIWMRQSAQDPTTVDPKLHDHRALVDALIARNHDEAVSLIVSHLEAIRDELVSILTAARAGDAPVLARSGG
jgi:DNA-binding GntR family transcriptional regulator